MFDNVLYQSACSLLSDDIAKNTLPASILFSGPVASGKLTCALELARILSCQNAGEWNCMCSSCKKHKAMLSPSVLLLGSKNQTLEIKAASTTLLWQNADNTKHLEAARYLYLRAVRKLTARFNPVLWEGDDKFSKLAPLLQAIEEDMENVSPSHDLPENEELKKSLENIQKNCDKLEASFLYDALPVLQIRNMSAWAHLSSSSGKKVIIIENAEQMADSARNALLKILEEPPLGVLFILTSSRRGALLPTILSRVRTYSFFERSEEHQMEVVQRVFHSSPSMLKTPVHSVKDFLRTYLPVQPALINQCATEYFTDIKAGHVPDVQKTMQMCSGFDPRILFALFIEGLIDSQRSLLSSERGGVISALFVKELHRTYNNVTLYNQNPLAALEELSRNLLQINHSYKMEEL